MAEALTPITYEEAVIEIGRWLMHYPRRHVEQDAVISQDLAAEFEFEKFGIAIVILTLREIRNEYNAGNPWVPQTGYVLQEIKKNQWMYERYLARLSVEPVVLLEKPKEYRLNDDPYEGKFWAQFEDWERDQFIRDLPSYEEPIRKMILKNYRAPPALMRDEVIQKLTAKTQ